ncbi:hypothetical protein K3F43_07905 [Pseudomonas tussilaginis]|uniref:hypothetical protein n=1 Tax=unclassified Pseudomonas TaxID=196821 RepID=UPI000C6EA6BB|nr:MULTISPECIES: hypothetical protein [unclassified Pseudomonas]QYX49416.1 hypothetical protein K3F43_07905 [Pseudomonas sp. S11A 273]
MDEDELYEQALEAARSVMKPWVEQELRPMEEFSSWDQDQEAWRDDSAVIELKAELMEEFGDQFDEELIQQVADELERDCEWGRPELAD